MTFPYITGANPQLGKGRGVHFAERLKRKKSHSNNGCPLPNVFTIKYTKILIHSFIVKLHCLMHTVIALLE